MENNTIDLLAKCLARAEAKRFSPDEYLAKHTKSPEALRDLVSLALYLQHMPSAVPSDVFRGNSYKQLMKEAKKRYGSIANKKAE